MPDDDELQTTSPPWVTYGLVLANGLVFLLMYTDGLSPLWPDGAGIDILRHFGAASADLVWSGEVWRLIAAMFLHAAVWHLAMNMMVLYQVGPLLERTLGAARFALLYLASGLVGFCVSLVFHGGLSVGASGAIFGVLGAMLALASVTEDLRFRGDLVRVIGAVVIASLALGFALPMVDNSAHIGGLVSGFLFGYALLADNKAAAIRHFLDAGTMTASQALAQRPRYVLPATILSVLVFSAALLTSLHPGFSARYHAVMGVRALYYDHADDALAHVQAAEKITADAAATLFCRARFLLESDPENALAFARFAIVQTHEAPAAALATVLLSVGSADGNTFYDARSQRLVCDAAIAEVGDGSAPALYNNCAWMLLVTDDRGGRDPDRAMRWAQRAVADAVNKSGEERVTYIHTLAEAMAQAGRPAEAYQLLHNAIDVEKLTNDAFFKNEMLRFEALASKVDSP